MKRKEIIGNYDTTNTFTIHKGKDNSGNETIRIGTSDDSTTGFALLLLPIIPIILIILFIIGIIEAKKEDKIQEERMKKYVEEFYKEQKK